MIYCISIYIDNSEIVFARRFLPHTFIYLYWRWWMISLISIHVITSIWWMRFVWHWSILFPSQNTFEICTRLWFSPSFVVRCLRFIFFQYHPHIFSHIYLCDSFARMFVCDYCAYTDFYAWYVPNEGRKKTERFAANSVQTSTERFPNNTISHSTLLSIAARLNVFFFLFFVVHSIHCVYFSLISFLLFPFRLDLCLFPQLCKHWSVFVRICFTITLASMNAAWYRLNTSQSHIPCHFWQK